MCKGDKELLDKVEHISFHVICVKSNTEVCSSLSRRNCVMFKKRGDILNKSFNEIRAEACKESNILKSVSRQHL